MALNPIDLATLAAGLTAGHPVNGAYNADDAIAASEVMALNLSGPPDFDALRSYCLSTRFRTRYLWGAIRMVSEAPIDSTLPFGPGGSNVTMTDEIIASARNFEMLLLHGTPADLNDANLSPLFSDLVDAGSIGTGDSNALKALSSNQSSHAAQMGLPRVRAADVTAARAL